MAYRCFSVINKIPTESLDALTKPQSYVIPCIIYDSLVFFAKNKLTLLVITYRPVYLQIGISVLFSISVLFGNSMDPKKSNFLYTAYNILVLLILIFTELNLAPRL